MHSENDRMYTKYKHLQPDSLCSQFKNCGKL